MILRFLFRKSKLILNKVDHVVLDEVDQMLDMGFSDIVDEILKYAYNGRSRFVIV